MPPGTKVVAVHVNVPLDPITSPAITDVVPPAGYEAGVYDPTFTYPGNITPPSYLKIVVLTTLDPPPTSATRLDAGLPSLNTAVMSHCASRDAAGANVLLKYPLKAKVPRKSPGVVLVGTLIVPRLTVKVNPPNVDCVPPVVVNIFDSLADNKPIDNF